MVNYRNDVSLGCIPAGCFGGFSVVGFGDVLGFDGLDPGFVMVGFLDGGGFSSKWALMVLEWALISFETLDSSSFLVFWWIIFFPPECPVSPPTFSPWPPPSTPSDGFFHHPPLESVLVILLVLCSPCRALCVLSFCVIAQLSLCLLSDSVLKVNSALNIYQ